ncbi:MAG: VanZ family protein [Eubacterium sp.]|nr:VanZ family protein [Eubacterium sp.]
MRLKVIWFLTLLAVLGMMIMIFLFSREDADRSSDKSSAVTEYIVETAERVIPALTSKESMISRDSLETLVRKCAHFLEYALLSFFLNLHFLAGQALWLREGLAGGKVIKRSAAAILVSFLYALTDEFHQFFVPGRAARLADVGIDSLGALFGLLLFLTLSSQKGKMWMTYYRYRERI